MKKKLQVFVSSTYKDLIDERQAAVEAILDEGHIPAGMELFKGGKSQLETIKRWIDDSDVHLLILGGRYGSIDKDTLLSYTQLEYEYALSRNMPVFAVVLDEEYLLEKSKKLGVDNVLELWEKKQLYEDFKKLVETKVVRFANNIDSLKYQISNYLGTLEDDNNYELTGWVRGNNVLDDLSIFNEDKLKNIHKNVLNEILSKNYNFDVSDFTETLSKDIFNGVNYKGIFDSVERTVSFLFIDNDMVKVTITSHLNYIYLDKKHQSYGIRFDATQQQAESFKVEKLLINQIDHTNDFEWEIVENKRKGQFVYRVQSKKSIHIPQVPCDIYYTCSYICKRLDFFQAYRLPFPCRHFSVNAYLLNENDKYSIIGSTFSSFSTIHSDDYEASEMKNYEFCNLRLPKWSLSGAGYVLTLMKRSKKGHL